MGREIGVATAHSERRIGVAVVGLGFGAEFVPIYKKHPDVGLVGVSDLDPAVMSSVADRFGIEVRLESLDAVLADGRFDAVHLFTQVPAHANQAVKVLEAGKHCACAVPMATSVEDLQRIVDAQRRHGKNYMLMETAVYDRAFLYAKGLLDSGELGKLTFLSGQYFQDLEGDFPSYWRGVPPMHYATHSLSPLLALAQTRAISVTCLGSGRLRADLQQPGGNTFPLQAALFRLANTDVVAQLTRSWFQIARQFTEAFSLYGDLRGFEWQQLDQEDPVLYTMGPVREGERGRNVAAERVQPPYRPDLYPSELAEFVAGWHGGSHPHLAHEFVRSIIEQRKPAIDAKTAANWTAAGICANDSSMLDGAPVTIPEF
ncbi:MAG: Gfo/Idh/MocA family protein [Fimbriimonadaceae bacterium]